MQDRISQVKRDLRKEKLIVKQQMRVNRNLISSIKNKHAEILAVEEKIQSLTGEIKKAKQEGLTADEARQKDEQQRSLVRN